MMINGFMTTVFQWVQTSDPILGCFFCGVDSKALILFFIIFACCLVLAAASFLSWAWMRGDFKDVEGPKFDMLKGEISENAKTESKTEPSENRVG